ncbi:MAG: hypothetical protein DA405_11200 [Bacteroidetes bacterium]|nr:MAG: hypothetical protein DA405_11200 [Bacteroidota bacterium]
MVVEFFDHSQTRKQKHMKLTYRVLLLWLAIPLLATAQSSGDSSTNFTTDLFKLQVELQRLQESYSSQQNSLKILTEQFPTIRNATANNAKNIEFQISNLEGEMAKFQERQAQSKSDLSSALEDLQKSVDNQKTLTADLQDSLAAKVSLELTLAAVFFVVLIVLFLMLNKRALNKGFLQNQSNWNQFQDHFLKSKRNE